MAIKIETPEGGVQNIQSMGGGDPDPIDTTDQVIGTSAETVDVNTVDDIVDDSGEDENLSTWGKPREQTADDSTDDEGEGNDGEEDPNDDPNKKPEDDDDDDPADHIKDTDTSEEAEFFNGVGSLLKDKGFFNNDVEIKSEEDLAEAFEKELQERLDATTKQALEYMGMGVPQQEIVKIQSALQEVEAITPEVLKEDQTLAKNLVYSEFLYKGFSEADAAKYTDLIEKAGDLEAESIKAAESRKQNLLAMSEGIKEKYKARQENAEKEHREYVQNLVKSLDEGEVFGKKLSSTTVDKLKKTFNTVVGYTPEGEPVNAVMKYKLENPVDFEHKLLYLFTVTDGFKNLKAFERSAESKVSRRFKDSVTRLSSGKSFSDKHTTPKTKIDLDTIDDIV